MTEELVNNTEGKTDCQEWDTHGWGGYERVLPPEVEHHIGKDRTSASGTNQRYLALLRQEDGTATQNKFGKEWEQTKVTTQLVVSYFNWMWKHSRLGNTATQTAGLASETRSWQAFATFRTLR